MEEVKTRVCPKCGEEKPLTEEFWPKNCSKKNGLERYCIKCKKEYDVEYYQKNKEKILFKQRKYYSENTLRCLQANKKYYEKNKDIIYLKSLKYKHDHLLLTRQYRNNWIIRNPEKNEMIIKASRKKRIKNIDVHYVRSLIHQMGIDRIDITPEMIELKRVQIQLFRKTKQFLKEEAA